MTTATLTHLPAHSAGRNAFTFEHAMAHRNYMAVMAPLTQWSVMPYFIDPANYRERPGTNWHLNHKQAHHDFTTFLPAYRDQSQSAWDTRPGIPTDQNLLDTQYQRPGSKAWSTFLNHQEHYTANSVIGATPLTGPTADLPWWILGGRLATVFW